MHISKKMCVLAFSIVFVIAVIPVQQVEALKPLRWETASSVNLPPWSQSNPTWIGDVYTEDGLHGNFYWFNETSFLLGPEDNQNVMKFWGIWWADFDDGSYVQGTHDGSFTYAINQYTINGRVTVATDQWSDLVGRKVHTVGIVDWTGGVYGIGYSESIFQIN